MLYDYQCLRAFALGLVDQDLGVGDALVRNWQILPVGV
jgi:hypothetical protein